MTRPVASVQQFPPSALEAHRQVCLRLVIRRVVQLVDPKTREEEEFGGIIPEVTLPEG